MHVVYGAFYLKCYSVHMSTVSKNSKNGFTIYKICDKEKHCLIWNFFADYVRILQ